MEFVFEPQKWNLVNFLSSFHIGFIGEEGWIIVADIFEECHATQIVQAKFQLKCAHCSGAHTIFSYDL